MKVRRFSWVVVCAATALFAGMQRTASAGLSIVSQSVKIDQQDQDASFSVTFNHVPDLVSKDAFGRHAESFQYEIVPNVTNSISNYGIDDVRAVVRGDEIGTGHLLPIRDGIEHGSDPTLASGGWGSVKAQVPFTLTGNTLSFNTTFAMLGSTSGNFTYRVFTTDFGSTGSLIQSVSVPLPPALPVAGAMLALLGGVALLKRLAH